MRFLIVGAGFTGSVIAERIASQLGGHVTLIDRRPHIGGNAFDTLNAHGVHIHQYGPHIFHTNAKRIVDYLSKFTDWRPYEHRAIGFIDGEFVPVPINLTSLEMVFGENEGRRLGKMLTDEYGAEVKVPILAMRASKSDGIRRLADVIYDKFFLHYTMKQWGMSPEELDPSVSSRVPVYLSRDDRYFQDGFQAMPAMGYAALFQKMLDHPLIEIRTATDYQSALRGETFDQIIFTGPIDEYFDRRHGALPYRSIKFEWKSTKSDRPIQRAAQENYATPSHLHAYTRSTEFRYLTGQDDIDMTTQVFEFPEAYVAGRNEPYYPIPREENRILFQKYRADADQLNTVIFAGRLADYQYYNMDQAVARALSCFEKQISVRH